MNETELLRLTQYVANQLKSKFQFDIYDQDDIEQEIYFLILEAAKRFDEEKSTAEQFFYHFVRNRLITLKRDKYFNENSAESKKLLYTATSLSMEVESPACFSNSNFLDIVDEKIVANLREDFLKLRDGVSIPHHSKQKVLAAMRVIAEAEEYDVD
jgi:DNA-directed RNA polymerase specialized sigma24 family protein